VLDYFLTEEHVMIREMAREIADNEIRPVAAEYDRTGEFPWPVVRTMAAAGLFGVFIDEAYGGIGDENRTMNMVLVTEELSKACGGISLSFAGTALGTLPIILAASEEQKQRWLPAIASGERLAAFALTEPQAGSDAAGIRTTAVRDGDHYVVNGAKTFITSGCRADFVTTAVRTGGEGHGGISLLVIERGTPGFSVSKKLRKTGWWASDTAELAFDDCRVPLANRIGEENAGFRAIMINFVVERLALAAQCVAIAELAYRESVAYARERSAFGKPLTGFQVTRHKLAEMATRIAAARALTGECIARRLAGDESIAPAAMAKNTGTDMCSWVCDQAVQIHGGAGYMRETVVERLYRDARLYPIGGGTREIMNEIISKAERY
jgi:acyl-CoA dehydrogenase